MQDFGDIRQIGYVCRDAGKSLQRWIDKGALGPCILYRNLTLPMLYRGELSLVSMHVGLGFRGPLQIEFIEQTNDAPSPYLACYQGGNTGLHHIAFATRDMTRSLTTARQRGYDIVATIDGASGRYAYFQDPELPDTYYEFLELAPATEAYWEQCIAQSRAQDGPAAITAVDMSTLQP
jgi:hypothetical protein